MWVYRFEKEFAGLSGLTRKVGPYISGDWAEMFNRPHDDKDHPTPIRDKGIERGKDWDEVCAFANLYQAFKWFSFNEVAAMFGLGYEFNKYWVNKNVVTIGEHQCLVHVSSLLRPHAVSQSEMDLARAALTD